MLAHKDEPSLRIAYTPKTPKKGGLNGRRELDERD